MASALSVPTQGARWMSASSAAFVRRVSTVMILQPRALALTRDSHQPSGCAQTFVAMIMKERVFSVGMAPVDGRPQVSCSACMQPARQAADDSLAQCTEPK